MMIVLNGDPTPLVRTKKDIQFWDDYARTRFLWERDLEEYKSPILTGCLIITVTFVMPFRNHLAKEKRIALENTYMNKRPYLSQLISAVEELCRGTLFKDGGSIARIVGEKRYGNDPRTIITIERE